MLVFLLLAIMTLRDEVVEPRALTGLAKAAAMTKINIGCAALVSASDKPIMIAGEAKRGSDTLDEALDSLKNTGPEYRGGLANHGPMGAEALCALGRYEAVLPWVERYKKALGGRPASSRPISREGWREAMGDFGRAGDWIAFFERELSESPWREVLNLWALRLAPGLIAAAAHGIIRTAHAGRSLAASETRPRRRELAEGLAYWAARYQTLPESMAGTPGHLSPSEAIAAVEPVPLDRQRRSGLITSGLEVLQENPSFDSAIDLADPSADASRFISDLTATFARVYLANAPRNFIALLHAVTGTGSLRLLVPHVSPETRLALLRYGWQAGAALYAAFATKLEPDRMDLSKEAPEDLIDRAVATGDEHAFKFTETCLREHALAPRPEYLAATRHLVGLLA
jgi:hypothetical protein